MTSAVAMLRKLYRRTWKRCKSNHRSESPRYKQNYSPSLSRSPHPLMLPLIPLKNPHQTPRPSLNLPILTPTPSVPLTTLPLRTHGMKLRRAILHRHPLLRATDTRNRNLRAPRDFAFRGVRGGHEKVVGLGFRVAESGDGGVDGWVGFAAG